MPPIPISLIFKTSIFHFLLSAYIEYILKRSPANSAASSPPAPPLISTITFLSSLGSFGRSNIFNSSSIFSILALAVFDSSTSISLNSLSVSGSSINALASSIVSIFFLYSLYFSTIGVRSECSLHNLRQVSWSAMTSGSLIFFASSSNCSSKNDSFSNILFSS